MDQPKISDSEYDNLLRELLELEAKYPDLVTLDSPTQRVGGIVAKEFPKVRHLEPLLSLDNAFNAGELREFDRRVRSVVSPVQYVVELKVDGLTVVLTYEHGVLVRAATRGDGEGCRRRDNANCAYNNFCSFTLKNPLPRWMSAERGTCPSFVCFAQ